MNQVSYYQGDNEIAVEENQEYQPQQVQYIAQQARNAQYMRNNARGIYGNQIIQQTQNLITLKKQVYGLLKKTSNHEMKPYIVELTQHSTFLIFHNLFAHLAIMTSCMSFFMSRLATHSRKRTKQSGIDPNTNQVCQNLMSLYFLFQLTAVKYNQTLQTSKSIDIDQIMSKFLLITHTFETQFVRIMADLQVYQTSQILMNQNRTNVYLGMIRSFKENIVQFHLNIRKSVMQSQSQRKIQEQRLKVKKMFTQIQIQQNKKIYQQQIEKQQNKSLKIKLIQLQKQAHLYNDIQKKQKSALTSEFSKIRQSIIQSEKAVSYTQYYRKSNSFVNQKITGIRRYLVGCLSSMSVYSKIAKKIKSCVQTLTLKTLPLRTTLKNIGIVNKIQIDSILPQAIAAATATQFASNSATQDLQVNLNQYSQSTLQTYTNQQQVKQQFQIVANVAASFIAQSNDVIPALIQLGAEVNPQQLQQNQLMAKKQELIKKAQTIQYNTIALVQEHYEQHQLDKKQIRQLAVKITSQKGNQLKNQIDIKHGTLLHENQQVIQQAIASATQKQSFIQSTFGKEEFQTVLSKFYKQQSLKFEQKLASLKNQMQGVKNQLTQQLSQNTSKITQKISFLSQVSNNKQYSQLLAKISGIDFEKINKMSEIDGVQLVNRIQLGNSYVKKIQQEMKQNKIQLQRYVEFQKEKLEGLDLQWLNTQSKINEIIQSQISNKQSLALISKQLSSIKSSLQAGIYATDSIDKLKLNLKNQLKDTIQGYMKEAVTKSDLNVNQVKNFMKNQMQNYWQKYQNQIKSFVHDTTKFQQLMLDGANKSKLAQQIFFAALKTENVNNFKSYRQQIQNMKQQNSAYLQQMMGLIEKKITNSQNNQKAFYSQILKEVNFKVNRFVQQARSQHTRTHQMLSQQQRTANQNSLAILAQMANIKSDVNQNNQNLNTVNKNVLELKETTTRNNDRLNNNINSVNQNINDVKANQNLTQGLLTQGFNQLNNNDISFDNNLRILSGAVGEIKQDVQTGINALYNKIQQNEAKQQKIRTQQKLQSQQKQIQQLKANQRDMKLLQNIKGNQPVAFRQNNNTQVLALQRSLDYYKQQLRQKQQNQSNLKFKLRIKSQQQQKISSKLRTQFGNQNIQSISNMWKQKQNDFKKLKNQYSKIQSQLQNKSQSKQQKQKQLRNLQLLIRKANDQLYAISFKQLQDEGLTELIKKYSSLIAQTKIIQNTNKKQITKLKSAIQKLEQQINMVNQQKTVIEAKNTQAQRLISTLKNKSNDTNKQIKQMNQLQKKYTQLMESSSKQKFRLSQIISTYKKKILQYEEKLSDMQHTAQRKNYESQYNQAKLAIRKLEEQASSKNKQIQLLQSHKVNLQSKIITLNLDIAHQKTQIDKMVNSQIEIDSENLRLTNNINRMQKIVSQLKIRSARYQQSQLSLKTQLQAAKTQIIQLQKQIKNRNQANASLLQIEKELNQYKKKYQNQFQKSSFAQRNLQQLNMKHSKYQQNLQQTQRRIKQLQNVQKNYSQIITQYVKKTQGFMNYPKEIKKKQAQQRQQCKIVVRLQYNDPSRQKQFKKLQSLRAHIVELKSEFIKNKQAMNQQLGQIAKQEQKLIKQILTQMSRRNREQLQKIEQLHQHHHKLKSCIISAFSDFITNMMYTTKYATAIVNTMFEKMQQNKQMPQQNRKLGQQLFVSLQRIFNLYNTMAFQYFTKFIGCFGFQKGKQIKKMCIQTIKQFKTNGSFTQNHKSRLLQQIQNIQNAARKVVDTSATIVELKQRVQDIKSLGKWNQNAQFISSKIKFVQNYANQIDSSLNNTSMFSKQNQSMMFQPKNKFSYRQSDPFQASESYISDHSSKSSTTTDILLNF